MSKLFTYPREDWSEQYLDEFRPDELDEYKFEKTLFQLAGVFQHNQAEFDLGDLEVLRRFEMELEDLDLERFKTSAELRESSFLQRIRGFSYDTDETLSMRVVVCVIQSLSINDLCYRFGPTAFSNHVKNLISYRKDEAASILSAARKCKDCWVPWSWIKDMSLLCENEFSSVYTAYIKPPFVGSQTNGRKVYIRKVTDINIVTKMYQEIEENGCGRDHQAITFDSASGHVHFVAFSGEHQYISSENETASLEQVLAAPFNGWTDVLVSLKLILIGTYNPRNPKRGYHGQLHPKNIFRNLPVQFIWQRAVRDCLTESVYGRLPYLAPEAVERNAVPNLTWDIYAFGVIMWQMVSRVVFPPNQYLDKEVYQINRVPGVPEWYEQLYIACMDKDPSKRPTLDKIQADIELRSPKSKSVRVFRDIRLEPVDTSLLGYQNMRAELIKAHLEGMSAPDDLLWQSTSQAYKRHEVVDEVGFNLKSF
ncbi:hypothetical protein K450DRAFT_227223 [Umbelopsis ramanniana AG]|uniref:Protein kinase domain-containing protein n=1 Tax=Umbelopsis ramanniana AG TaxID=1314678 RepID=A0AAD5EEL8_UMBRA|nr:uncharacterized protein K450DRAFT_227223 [Umbelopsis ramanniana AG]KAI8582448.1 hypothetical protein K450DRAFT_227223 [Umbelopsis ramanniana AG]